MPDGIYPEKTIPQKFNPGEKNPHNFLLFPILLLCIPYCCPKFRMSDYYLPNNSGQPFPGDGTLTIDGTKIRRIGEEKKPVFNSIKLFYHSYFLRKILLLERVKGCLLFIRCCPRSVYTGAFYTVALSMNR